MIRFSTSDNGDSTTSVFSTWLTSSTDIFSWLVIGSWDADIFMALINFSATRCNASSGHVVNLRIYIFKLKCVCTKNHLPVYRATVDKRRIDSEAIFKGIANWWKCQSDMKWSSHSFREETVQGQWSAVDFAILKLLTKLISTLPVHSQNRLTLPIVWQQSA